MASSTSKEDAKNMALLFFMDHLMQKNGRRTIHDLSCQFGARGFSPEMREAVGTTQEGLTDFLSQFPSLFVIEGDSVTMTGYGDLAMGGAKASPMLQTLSRDRNYEQEAVEFFEEKLRRFGPELQIKSLLGHRSQSAPEIRLVSGRHVKDFTDFLSNFSENFVVENDRVRLKHMPEPSNVSDGESDDFGSNFDVQMDQGAGFGVRAMQKALEFLRATVEEVNNQPQGSDGQTAPLAVDSLYKKFCDRFSHKLRQQVAANPKELLQFLKLNRHIFFIRSNKVSIVRNRPTSTTLSAAVGDMDESPSSDRSSDGNRGGSTASPCLSTPSSERCAGFAAAWRVTLVKSLAAAQAATGDLTRWPAADVGVERKGDATAFKFLVDDRRRAFNTLAVGVDAKWATVGDRNFLSLLVVSSSDGSKLYVFDAAHSASIVLESGLKDLLESKDLVKVMHDCTKICTRMLQQYGIVVRNVFDTQIANSVLQYQRIGKPFNEMKAASFLTVQRLYHPQSLMYSDSSLPQPADGIKNWSTRPLTDSMLQCCVEEARFLMPFMYNSMNSALKPDMRSVFKRMCQEAASGQKHESAYLQTNYSKCRPNGALNGQSLLDPSSPEFIQNLPPISCCACKCHHANVASVALDQAYSKPRLTRDISCQTVASGDLCVVVPVRVDSSK